LMLEQLYIHMQKKKKKESWFRPVNPATHEAEIGRILMRGQSRQKASETSHLNTQAASGGVCLSFQL
jgi:hypothetical protein